MPLVTVNVTATIYDQTGQPVPQAVIRVKLDREEVDGGYYVVPAQQEFIADANGQAVMPLWPNSRGSTESTYLVRAYHPTTGRRILEVVAVVPEYNCNLSDIAALPPYPGKPEGAIAAQAAEVARVAAETAETNAELAEVNAESAQAAAEAARDAAVVARTGAEAAQTGAQSAQAAAEAARDAALVAETNAETAETNAEAAQAAAELALDSFDDRYLGAKAADPSLDNDGNALLTGALYWHTGSNRLKVYSGTAWVDYVGDAAAQAAAAAASASAAATSETNAANSATAAQTARTGAEAAETNAETAQAAAEAARNAAQLAETNAGMAEARASEWADQTEDVQITFSPGKYSAKHWSEKAADWGVRLPASVSGAKGKGLAVKSDETGYEHVGLLKRNVLINGDFRVWQVATSFAGLSASAKVADMTVFDVAAQGTWTISRDADVPPPASAGRSINYSYKALVTAADPSVAAGDYAFTSIRAEGYDYAPLYQQVQSVQFWVKSNKPGTYCVALRNNASDRSFVSEFTINAADTWEKKTITISAAPVGGTWDFTNGVGIRLDITFAAGTTYQTTAGSWQNGQFFATASQVNLADAVNNYIKIADVRLVAGFDADNIYIPSFAEQLSLCQRYYEKSYNYSTALGTIDAPGHHHVQVPADGTGFLTATVRYRAPKRAAATVVIYSANTGASGYLRETAYNLDRAASVAQAGETGCIVYWNDNATLKSGYMFHYVADARI